MAVNPFFDKYQAKLNEAFQRKQAFERRALGLLLCWTQLCRAKSPLSANNIDAEQPKKPVDATGKPLPKYVWITCSADMHADMRGLQSPTSVPGARRLDDMLNLQLIAPLSAAEIGDIWNKYHADKAWHRTLDAHAHCAAGLRQRRHPERHV